MLNRLQGNSTLDIQVVDTDFPAVKEVDLKLLELSKQLDVVRTQEGFRKLLNEAKDLEQLLCHAMDWLLRQLGYCNVAIWLTASLPYFSLT